MGKRFIFIYFIALSFFNSICLSTGLINFHDQSSTIEIAQGSSIYINDSDAIDGWEGQSIVQPSQEDIINVNVDNGITTNEQLYPTILDRIHIYDNVKTYQNNTTIADITWAKKGIVLEKGATVKVETIFGHFCPLDLNGGTLELGIDWHLSTSTTICPYGGGGNVKGNGYALIMNGNLVIPPGEYLKFVNDTIIDGLGHELILSSSAQLIVDMNTTLSLRNIIIKSLKDIPIRPSFVMNDTSSVLSMQNTKVLLDGDYTFTQGYVFVHDDVTISGSSKFIFESEQEFRIVNHSTLFLDTDVTFSYAPTNGSRTLLKFYNKTSFLDFNSCVFSAPGNSINNGIELIKGTLILDNRSTLRNLGDSGENSDQNKAITFGNNTAADDLNIKIYPSSAISIEGYVDYKNVS